MGRRGLYKHQRGFNAVVVVYMIKQSFYSLSSYVRNYHGSPTFVFEIARQERRRTGQRIWRGADITSPDNGKVARY